MSYRIHKIGHLKIITSNNYNCQFNKKTGEFYRWGYAFSDDPHMCPFGPEIADIEISTICNGINNKSCAFCYKSNTNHGKNMSLDTFSQILNKLPDTVCQIAFGVGDIHSNPDLYKILKATREADIVPNITINGWDMNIEDYLNLSTLCGAVSVSRYDPPDVCYNAVCRLTDLGLQQVNIHQLLCEETYDECLALLDTVKTEKRLTKLNSIVFLALKQCGRGKHLSPISIAHYDELITKAFKNKVSIGFDSCSAPLFLNSVKKLTTSKNPIISERQRRVLEMMAEPCESTLFSAYINVDGDFFPCSFCEATFSGLSVTQSSDFVEDIWNNVRVDAWRDNLLSPKVPGLVSNCRQCPEYKIWS